MIRCARCRSAASCGAGRLDILRDHTITRHLSRDAFQAHVQRIATLHIYLSPDVTLHSAVQIQRFDGSPLTTEQATHHDHPQSKCHQYRKEKISHDQKPFFTTRSRITPRVLRFLPLPPPSPPPPTAQTSTSSLAGRTSKRVFASFSAHSQQLAVTLITLAHLVFVRITQRESPDDHAIWQSAAFACST